MQQRLVPTRRLAPIGLLLVAGIGLSCRDAVAPAPQLQDVRPNSTPSYSATFGLATDTTTTHSIALQSFPEPRAVRITLSGSITGVHLFDATQNRRIGPAGWNCYGTVSVNYSGTVVGPVCNSGSGETAPTWESLPVVIHGSGQVSRGGSWSTICNGDPTMSRCWRFEGTQDVTVKVLDIKGIMKSNTSAVTYDQNVNFWWEFEPGAPGQTPYQTFEWWWVPVGGTPVYWKEQWDGKTSIFHWVTQSGTMYVRVKVNGVEQVLERYVHHGPPSLRLEASPTPVFAGDTVQFKAEVKPDSTAASNFRWFWLPEEPIIGLRAESQEEQEPHPSSEASSLHAGDSLEVAQCAGLRQCSYLVTWNGRMRVHALVGGTQKSADRHIVVEEPQDRIQVTCLQVLRRETTTCTAESKVPGAALQVSGWKFVSSQTEAPFEYSREGAPSDPTWRGTVLLEGTVNVRGRVGGVASTGTAVLTLQDNPLSDVIQPTVSQLTPSELLDPPSNDHDLGVTYWTTLDKVPTLGSIASGPNTGVVYYQSLPYALKAEVDINTAAFASTSMFTRMQSAARRTVGGVPYCSKGDVPVAEPKVRAHEGFARTDPYSHVQTYTDAFEFHARRWFGRWTSEHNGSLDDVRYSIEVAALNESYAITHGVNPFTMPCYFNYDASLTFP